MKRSWPILTFLISALCGTAAAQDVPTISPVEELDFDRPEAWAMKYFGSVSLLTGLGAPRERRPGSVELAFEAGWIPSLSEEQRTVGFGGTKEEDLNKLSAFGRLRATFGLGRKLSLTAGWVPPVAVSGVQANLVSLALERPLLAPDAGWGLGLRLYGQVGEIEGDFTCTDDDLQAPPGEPGNEFGCEARSSDTYDLAYTGLELVGSYAFAGGKAPRLHFGAAANYLDMELQVDALTSGLRDRTLLLADGWSWSLSGGARWGLDSRTDFAAELFYTPLDVVRPPSTASENDALFNLRLLVAYRLR